MKTSVDNAGKLCVHMTQSELDALSEYSCSLPTGTTIGKSWKRNVNAYTGRADSPDWWMGYYTESDLPGQVGIEWRRVVLPPVESVWWSRSKIVFRGVLESVLSVPRWFRQRCGRLLNGRQGRSRAMPSLRGGK